MAQALSLLIFKSRLKEPRIIKMTVSFLTWHFTA